MSDKKSKKKMLPRYGSNLHKHYVHWGYGVILFLAVSILKKRIDVGVLIGTILLMLLHYLLMNTESYVIQDRLIITKKYFFFKKTISLPNELTLLVVNGSILTFPNRRYHGAKTMVALNNCYMVCIVDNCNLREALNLMHWNRFCEDDRYSNVIVREIFLDNTYSDFLYSFEFDSDVVKRLVENHTCQIILPKSLQKKVDLSGIDAPIYVDDEG